MVEINLTPAQYKSARRFAVQFIYQCEITNQFFFQENSFTTFLSQFSVSVELNQFLRTVVKFTLNNLATIDADIEEQSKNWKLSRMAKVDLAILRVCSAELLCRPEIKKEMIIADAAEIGKEYGTSNSSAFVNGLLDAVVKKIRKG